MLWSECEIFEATRPHHRKDVMDFRFLLVLLLPALVTAGTSSAEPMSLETGYEGDHLGLGGYRGDKVEDDDSVDFRGSVSSEVVNQGSAIAHAAAEEYGTKAKAVEQSAKWFRNLLGEKEMILSQLKKRAKLLRALAADSMHNAEQHRKSAAEKYQTSKALETKARELESLSKEQAIQAGDLRAKMNNEMKQYLESLINKDVAETNADINLAEAERQRTWGAYMEKQAQELISEAVKWERTSAESQDQAKKLKTDASRESAKAKELEKKRKEIEDAANETGKKAQEFRYFGMEFRYKSLAEDHQAVLARIKAKYLQLIAASTAEQAQYLHMFANMENKDGTLWEKRTASLKAEAKLLEDSAKKMYATSEKLKASLKKEPPKTEKKGEVQEARTVKSDSAPQPNTEVKSAEVPKSSAPERKV